MYSLLILAVSSFFVALALTPLCRGLAIRFGLVDRPDEIRKFHSGAVPRVGGISIFVAYLTSFAIFLFWPFHFGNIVREHLDVVRNLFPAATIIFFTGLVDDLHGLKAWQKFAAQFAASGVAILTGIQIS